MVDTVEQYVEGTGAGTGFLFTAPEESAVYDTLGWACATFYDRPDELARLRANAMARDFSWNNSVDRYAEVYGWAITARHSASDFRS